MTGMGPVNQPTTSMTTSVQPKMLSRSTLPVGPTWATTRFGTVTPAFQLRSDASGCAAPSGQAMRALAWLVSVTVTLATTAVGGLGSVIRGTPAWPATVTARPLLGPHGVQYPPVP